MYLYQQKQYKQWVAKVENSIKFAAADCIVGKQFTIMYGLKVQNEEIETEIRDNQMAYKESLHIVSLREIQRKTEYC